MTDVDVILKMDWDASWSLQLLCLDTSRKLVASIQPGIVVVKPHPSSQIAKIWPPPAKKRRKREVEAHFHWDMLAEELSPLDDDQDIIYSGSDAGSLEDVGDMLLEAEALDLAFGLDVDEEMSVPLQAATEQATPLEDDAGSLAHGQPSASSVDIVAPLAPAVHPPPVPKHRGPDMGLRVPAMSSIVLAHGKVTFDSARNSFEASCREHPQCVLTRTSKSKGRRGGVVRGGRPVGFLCGWLSLATQCSNKAEHMNKELWKQLLHQDCRTYWRRKIAETAEGRSLLACERAIEDGEENEAVTLDGYL